MNMGLDGIKVHHASLEQTSADLLAKVKQIDDRLNRLEGELGHLKDQWSGEAKLAYNRAKATWDQAIVEMRNLLESTGRSVDQSNQDYRAADKRGAALFGG